MRSDRDLIRLYEDGNEEAFREFYSRHRRVLFLYLLSLVRSRETAEELLQDTFYSFLSSLGRLNGSANLRPYLVRTARNRAFDHLRRSRRDAEAIEWRAEDALFNARGQDAAGRGGLIDPDEVSRLVQGLPEEQREAVILRVFAGMTFREIAALAGCPEASVVSRYRYGLEKLRAAWKKDWKPDWRPERCEHGTGRAVSRT